MLITLCKSFVFTLVFPGTVAVYIPFWLAKRIFAESALYLGGFRYVGCFPLALGVLIYLWCVWDFASSGKGTPLPLDPPKSVVHRGLYRYVRNPMYIGMLNVILGEAFLYQSIAVFLYMLVMFCLFHTFVIIHEEPTLKRLFGASYEEYLASTPRWLPKI